MTAGDCSRNAHRRRNFIGVVYQSSGLGLPRLALHGLRHTHATLLLEEGVDIKTVSERLGHENVETTLRTYSHVTPKMRLSAAARFADPPASWLAIPFGQIEEYARKEAGS